MTYDSLDIIPAKLFFKIAQSGEISLLTDEQLSEEALNTIWEELEEEHSRINPNSQADKSLDLYKRIEALQAKQQAILLSCKALLIQDDEELRAYLESLGYRFRGDRLSDIERIIKESRAITDKIDRIKAQLPKPKTDKNTLSFDEAVMSYASFIGQGFIDTNKITITQYYALVSMGDQKMKALESQNQKYNGKR